MIIQRTLYEIDNVRDESGFSFYCYMLDGGPVNVSLVPPHWHNELEIMFSRAQGILYINDEAFDIEDGDLFFINPRLIHRTYRISIGPMYHIVFDLNQLKIQPSENVFNRLIDDITEHKRKFPEKIARDSELYRELLPAVLSMCEHSYQAVEFGYQSCHMLSLLFSVMAACYKADSFKTVNESSLYGMRYVARVMEYIDHNYQENISVPMLAKKMNISETYLYRLFKDYAGLTPISYINSVRLRNAYRLLDEGKNVTETAVTVGIPNISYFIKLFKEATGQTPSSWLKCKKDKS